VRMTKGAERLTGLGVERGGGLAADVGGGVLLRRPGEEAEGGSERARGKRDREGASTRRSGKTSDGKRGQRRGGGRWAVGGGRRETRRGRGGRAARAVDVGTSVSRCEGRNRSLPGLPGAGKGAGRGGGEDDRAEWNE